MTTQFGSVAAEGGRVVILEDQPLMGQSLSDILQGAGFAVAGIYCEPDLFLSRLPVDLPAVAIIDLGLNGGHRSIVPDGMATLRELRNRYPDVKPLVFSGATERATVDRCYQEGAAGYLDKLSTEGEALISAVRAVLRGERLFPMNLLDSPLSVAESKPTCPVLDLLSVREREVLSYVAAGADNLKIATFLQVSERTVKAHVSALYRKLEAENRTQLALTGLKGGITPREE